MMVLQSSRNAKVINGSHCDSDLSPRAQRLLSGATKVPAVVAAAAAASRRVPRRAGMLGLVDAVGCVRRVGGGLGARGRGVRVPA